VVSLCLLGDGGEDGRHFWWWCLCLDLENSMLFARVEIEVLGDYLVDCEEETKCFCEPCSWCWSCFDRGKDALGSYSVVLVDCVRSCSCRCELLFVADVSASPFQGPPFILSSLHPSHYI
jgi:hypothetical protein